MTTTKERKAAAATFDRTELLAALTAVLRAVSERTQKPILSNVRLGDGLITGTDLELRIDREIDYHGDPMLLPGHRLQAILKAANGDEVRIVPKGSTVQVKCGRGEWTLPTEDAAEFPTWEPADTHAICRLPGDQFARAVAATVFATDNESSRFALGGVLVEVKDGNPTWVATDGRRLACVETETDQAVDDSETIVPARVLQVAAGMAGGGSVQIDANGTEVVLSMDGVTVTGRLVAGRFPRWRDVMGEAEGSPAVIDRLQLLSAVRAAAIVTSEQSKGVRLTWTGKGLSLACRSAEYGESAVVCQVEVAGDCAGTLLDPAFLVDYLQHLPVDEDPNVELFAQDEKSRVLLRCGEYRYVIMPLDPS